jgi:hypothetical protein
MPIAALGDAHDETSQIFRNERQLGAARLDELCVVAQAALRPERQLAEALTLVQPSGSNEHSVSLAARVLPRSTRRIRLIGRAGAQRRRPGSGNLCACVWRVGLPSAVLRLLRSAHWHSHCSMARLRSGSVRVTHSSALMGSRTAAHSTRAASSWTRTETS